MTLLLDAAGQERFDALRRAHFPARRNHLAAHVTLFHALPGEQLVRVAADLAQAAAGPPYDVEVVGVRFLGRGVAYDLRSAELSAVRARLARAWDPWLTPQDRQLFRPHVTVQNKVAPERARALQAELDASFVPFVVRGEGLSLWRYLGGPWELVDSFCDGPGAA